MEKQNEQKKTSNWFTSTITGRMLVIAVLLLAFFIPLTSIQHLINERSDRQKETIKTINEKWGNDVTIYGPILKVPYKTFKTKKLVNDSDNSSITEQQEIINYAYFFPENLKIEGNINPKEKYYGIYKTAVYESNLVLSGNFEKPSFSEVEVSNENILWDKARVILQLSNLKGVNNSMNINFLKNTYAFSSKYSKEDRTYNMHSLESSPINLKSMINENNTFSIDLSVKGSESIQFIPIGKETTAHIQSKWKNAHFFGEYLPFNEDKISENGFDAKWKVLAINRPFSQQYYNQIPVLLKYAGGISFIIPVDEYQKNERSAKYGFLVIALTFLSFFLIQTWSKIYIHPFQYVMIGMALVMFYTLLLSISEHSTFSKAYLIASIAVISLITLYSRSILKKWKFPALISMSLLSIYTFIFIIIRLENYALLVGSIGLFVILALVMYASKKIDWSIG
ncbi:cell envelope integrity protein CreD [Zhouia sp. PK063]|uniref:cell envelope integrity protein CreD n=1 Tax=Zhouia sp. PK063 TaxID=3373602 RepID=UPI0037BBF033